MPNEDANFKPKSKACSQPWSCFLRQSFVYWYFKIPIWEGKKINTIICVCISLSVHVCVRMCTRSSPLCLLLPRYTLFLNCICLCIIVCDVYDAREGLVSWLRCVEVRTIQWSKFGLSTFLWVLRIKFRSPRLKGTSTFTPWGISSMPYLILLI